MSWKKKKKVFLFFPSSIKELKQLSPHPTELAVIANFPVFEPPSMHFRTSRGEN